MTSKRAWLLLATVACAIVPLSLSIVLTRNASANQLNIIDYDYEGILAGETQYFAIYNDASNTSMGINMTTLEFAGWTTPYPNISIGVYAWNDYRHGNANAGLLATNVSGGYYNNVSFQCIRGHRYVVKIVNLDPVDDATYNLTIITGPGVLISNSVAFIEQGWVAGKVVIGYYQQTDPWLYDSLDGYGRITIPVGYWRYGAQEYIKPFGERYFTVQNVYTDIVLFVGVTVYTLDPYGTGASCTLGVIDWAMLDAGSTDWIDLAFTIGNYSAGFNFTCLAGHTYQVYFKNGDSAYGVFINATFNTWGQASMRFDNDLDPEPPTDQIRVRLFSYDPWLDMRRSERELLYGWIFGGAGAGIGGVLVTAFFIKRRYR